MLQMPESRLQRQIAAQEHAIGHAPAQEMELAEQARALGYRPVATANGLIIWAKR